jgi:regulator of replication initiation timing
MINLRDLRKIDIYIINNLKNKIKLLNNKIYNMNQTEKQYIKEYNFLKKENIYLKNKLEEINYK